MKHTLSNHSTLFHRLWASVVGHVLVLLLALLGFAGSVQAAAPVFQAAGASVSTRNTDVSVLWPAHAVNDVALLITESKGGDAVTLSVPAGFALIGFQEQGTRTRVSYYWARASSTTMAAPSIRSVDHITAVILTYRGVTTTNPPWDVFGGSSNSSGGNPKSTTSITTTLSNTLIVEAASRDNDRADPSFSLQGNVNLTGIAERFDGGTTLGNGGGYSVWDGVKATAGATGGSTFTITPGARSAWMSVALKPPTTTLATGTDPAAATIGPGVAATDVDGFTLQTSGGTETITSVTVNLSTNAGVGVLAITDSAGVVLGSTTTPVIGLNTITVSGMSAIAATATAFKVRVTPLSHALMPAVPGASYAITAPVTAWAGTNEHVGTDTSPILTIDNASPASATAFSATAGDTKITLSWTTSAAADFSRSVVLRWLGGTAGAEVPVEGVDYAVGDAIGTASVACMRSTDAAATAVTGVDGGGTGGCSAVALTNDQAYTYKVFQKDANGNYDAGAGPKTATPVAAPSVTSFNAFESTTPAGAIAGPIYTKLAGTSFVLDVVAIASGVQSVGFSDNVKVELLANNTPGAGYGADNCPTSNVVIQTIASTPIAGGRSPVSFAAVANAYRDVRVRVSYPAVGTPTVITCSADSFAIRPVSFVITSTNATNTGTGGTPIFKTGDNFNLTASTGAGYDGTPSLDATKTVGSPTAGILAGVFGAAVGGVAAGNAFTYSEVGNIGLNTNAVLDTSFTSIDQPGAHCTDDFSTTLVGGKYGCKIGSTAVAQTVGVSGFGRFIPDHFTISLASVTPFCSTGTGFTYFGQDGFTTAFTLTAQNAANATTVNYKGAYAKLDLTAYASYGFTAATLPAGSSLASSATAPTGTWVDGVALVTAKHQISRPTLPTAPTDITVSAAPTDSDGSSVAATAIGGATNFRYGRLKLSNAYGSSLLALPVPLEAQYWTGSYYAANTLDNCTVIPISSIRMGNYLGQLNACETKLPPTGNVTLNAGKLSGLILTKPGATNGGSVDLAINVTNTPAGKTCVGATQTDATAANMPWFGPNLNARATFGIYKSPLIYRRENY